MVEDQENPTTQAFSRTDRSFLGSWWWTVDRSLLGCVLLLAAMGVALVSTASPSVAQTIHVDDYHFLFRHILFLAPSLILMIVLSMLSPRYIWRFASVVFMGGILAMVLVLFTGEEVKGAKRWLSIAGFSLQPSEFVKPAYAVVAAWLIALQKTSGQRIGTFKSDLSRAASYQEKDNFPGYNVAIFFYFIAIVLLLMQPDLGMTVVITCVAATQVFLAGLRFRYVAGLFGLGGMGLLCAYFGFHHVRSRIDRFLNPEHGDNYQVERSLDAIRNGGFLGKGIGQGTEKVVLPDAHADFIFSVMVEEMGVLFALVLVGMFLFIMMRGFSRLSENGDMFSVLAVGGLLTMFGLQALIHMGSAINILPAKGMTLPFISYGGSSVLAMGMAMGMVLALTRTRSRSSIAKTGLQIRSKQAQSTSEQGIEERAA